MESPAYGQLLLRTIICVCRSPQSLSRKMRMTQIDDQLTDFLRNLKDTSVDKKKPCYSIVVASLEGQDIAQVQITAYPEHQILSMDRPNIHHHTNRDEWDGTIDLAMSCAYPVYQRILQIERNWSVFFEDLWGWGVERGIAHRIIAKNLIIATKLGLQAADVELAVSRAIQLVCEDVKIYVQRVMKTLSEEDIGICPSVHVSNEYHPHILYAGSGHWVGLRRNTQRQRAIDACQTIKEELMIRAWHPSRLTQCLDFEEARDLGLAL